MIITRTWLEEFINLEDVSNQTLHELFNSIGLEVDSMRDINIPNNVLIGRVLSCKKHPDADKLNVCEVDIGEGVRQIVCGASNVKNAEYVAVATVGAKLSDDFIIKSAQLRGVQSDGMICSSQELGLPGSGEGIMELDQSIGILDIGRELNEYPKLADTIIELELTANRGDCLSIHGIARDLGVALSKDVLSMAGNAISPSGIAIAKELSVNNKSNEQFNLLYKLTEPEEINEPLLTRLRLGYVGLDTTNDALENLISYTTHATGVIIRAYDMAKLQNKKDKVILQLVDSKDGLVHITKDGSDVSIIGASQNDAARANISNKEILFEASYINPQSIIKGASLSKVDTDSLYYNTSRGSEPNLNLGFQYLELQINQTLGSSLTDSYVSIESEKAEKLIPVFFEELDGIIGTPIGKSETHNTLTRLGFNITKLNSNISFTASVPQHRHDIENIQDIAEELLRFIGIDKIKSRPLKLVEKVRLTKALSGYRFKRSLRQSAASNGFYEVTTYAFCNKDKLVKYGFPILKPSHDLINPIAEDFNTLRSTILVNLLDSAKRNINYGIKRVPLFEIGVVFDEKRDEKEMISFLWSGQIGHNNVQNQGKAKTVDFASFTEKLSSCIGEIKLVQTGSKNGLMHPFQSASVFMNGKEIGYATKLHPSVANDYNLPDTFIAEFELESIVPRHIDSQSISNFQGTYKDISIVLDDQITYDSIDESIASLNLSTLKRYFPIDVYSDESLKSQKSITIRLYIQSSRDTLAESDIESVVQNILQQLNNDFKATLR